MHIINIDVHLIDMKAISLCNLETYFYLAKLTEINNVGETRQMNLHGLIKISLNNVQISQSNFLCLFTLSMELAMQAAFLSARCARYKFLYFSRNDSWSDN